MRHRKVNRSRRTSNRATVTIAVAALVLAACGGESGLLDPARAAGLETCAPGTAVFSTSPVALSAVTGWVPLGAINPPAHTFPTDHQYLYLTTAAANVVAPGNAMITRARRTTYSTGGADYSIEFSPCIEIHAELGHVATIEGGLLARLGAFEGCSTYSPAPNMTATACYTPPIAVAVTAGQIVGTAGGPAGFPSIDFSAWDSRIDPLTYAKPSRWRATTDGFDSFHVVAASDYFAEPAKSEIAAKIGSFDGRARRRASPIGGTIAVDVGGTVRGMWFNPTQPTYPESPHLALVPDNVDPSKVIVSIGTSQPGFGSRSFGASTVSSGVVNRDPASIAADGRTYCYEGTGGAVWVRLIDDNTLRVEAKPSATCDGTFAFSSSAFQYVR